MDGSTVADTHNRGKPRAGLRGDLPATPINPLEPLVGGPTLREDRAFQLLKLLVDRARTPVPKPGQTKGEAIQRWIDGLTRTAVLLADGLDEQLAAPSIRADVADTFDLGDNGDG